MTMLTLIIPSDWPQDRRECLWLLRDADGHILQQGYSEPAHWPGCTPPDRQQSDFRPCELLLAGTQLACRPLHLPKSAQGHSPEIIAAAVEDYVLDDPALLCFSCPQADEGGTLRMLGVISRPRIEAIVEIMRSLGLSPRSAWPLGQAIPPNSACVCGNEITWRLVDGQFCSTRADMLLPHWFVKTDPAESGTVPPPLDFLMLTPETEPEINAALHSLEQASILRRSSRSNATINSPRGEGFLHGDLAPPRSRQALGRFLQPIAKLAAVFAVAALVIALVQWAWFAAQARHYRETITTSFRQAFPQAAMVDPLLQMRRQLALARRNAGQLTSNDFLYLADALADLPADSIQLKEMTYENGRLQVAAKLSTVGRAQLQTACRQRSINLRLPSDGPHDEEQTISFDLSAGEQP